jgi:Icc-related predicted phosphoesterase
MGTSMTMRLLLFSDLHRDLDGARAIVGRAPEADVVVVAGDLATVRRGLSEVVEVLRAIERPTILVPGNSETDDELRQACEDWTAAVVLHGEGTVVEGVPFFGLGAAVPVTPFGPWSFDLDEKQAEGLLENCPLGAVLVSHSPPFGHADRDRMGRSLGSRSVLEAVLRTEPRLVVCGHIHESWGRRSFVGSTPVINAGPEGMFVEIEAAE